MKRELGCEPRAAPATVSGEPACHEPLANLFGERLGRRHAPALTREPGDLPVAVVLRPAGVRRTMGFFSPEATSSGRSESSGQPSLLRTEDLKMRSISVLALVAALPALALP